MVSIGIAKEVTKQDRDWHTTPPIVLWQRMDCNRNFDALQPFQNNHRTRPPRQLIITPSFHPHTEPAATSSLVEAIPIGPAGNPQIPSQIGDISPRQPSSSNQPPVLDQVAVRMGNLATRSIWRLKASPYTALTLVLSKLQLFFPIEEPQRLGKVMPRSKGDLTFPSCQRKYPV
jgi:hypothetical protein